MPENNSPQNSSRGKRIDLTGQIFEWLYVMGRAPRGKSYDARYYVRCFHPKLAPECGPCGKITIVYALAFKSNKERTKSCGCYIKGVMSTNRVRKPGRPRRYAKYEGTRAYTSWVAAKSRCYNPNHRKRKRYGGRGITMYEPWRKNFEAFLAYMGPCPEGKSLDRWPNPDGNYEPGNVRWATPEEQANNKSQI